MDFNLAAPDDLSNPMPLNADVLHPTMVLWVLEDMKG